MTDPERILALSIGVLTLFVFALGIYLTFEIRCINWKAVIARLDDRLSRRAKYWRVRYSQSTVEERADWALYLAAVAILVDVLMVAAR